MEGPTAPARPKLAEQASQFMLLERAVEEEYRPRMLEELQRRVEAMAQNAQAAAPECPRCGQVMRRKDTRSVSWWALFGRLQVRVARYRCEPCGVQCRPLLDLLGVEPGRFSGSLARLLALLAVVAPYPLAAHLAWLLLGVKVSQMGVWRATKRLGQAAANYSEGLSEYHADSRSREVASANAPATVVLSVDGCALGMQVRAHRRRRKDGAKLPALPPVEEGHFREVKTGVLLLPDERVEISPGRHSVVRRFLVSCLGDADAIFQRLYAQLRELNWLDANTMVGDRGRRGRMDLEPRHVVRPSLRDSRLLARRGARLGICPLALRRRLGTVGPVGPCTRRRSTRRQSTDRDCTAEASAAEDGRIAREPRGIDSLLQRKRQPHAV